VSPSAQLFTAADFAAMSAIVFRHDYPGYATARGVVEAPNGDGALDTDKRYAHVAMKYLRAWRDANPSGTMNLQYCQLGHFLERAHARALQVAHDLGVPDAFLPSFEHGALRVLEYPPGARGHMHTDFDLFTLNLYRNVPNPGLPAGLVHMGELGELIGGLGPATPHDIHPMAEVQHSIVYFAIPDHEAVLPGADVTVGEWIKERIARSRVTTTEMSK
jgi:hypothetical protein